jgi:F-type H+-transporting ATPase subunit b
MRRLLFGLLLTACCFGLFTAPGQAAAQAAAAGTQSAPANQSQTQSAQPQQPENPNSAIGGELAKESREAAGEENAQFKYSASVRWFARILHLDEHQMYWVSLIINFGLMGLFFYFLLKSKLPQLFRERTVIIQKGIKEAQAASAEAARRLSDIEARLARLDTEVGEIRTSAEREAAAEEERIRQAAEEDKHKVVQAAETEITAIARNARRELKSYAASLAVDLASRKIRVDDPTDHALVREFVDQLGKDGQ